MLSAKVDKLLHKVQAAKEAVKKQLQQEYPIDSSVVYKHGDNLRGGIVIGYSCTHYPQVLIRRPSGSSCYLTVDEILDAARS